MVSEQYFLFIPMSDDVKAKRAGFSSFPSAHRAAQDQRLLQQDSALLKHFWPFSCSGWHELHRVHCRLLFRLPRYKPSERSVFCIKDPARLETDAKFFLSFSFFLCFNTCHLENEDSVVVRILLLSSPPPSILSMHCSAVQPYRCFDDNSCSQLQLFEGWHGWLLKGLL